MKKILITIISLPITVPVAVISFGITVIITSIADGAEIGAGLAIKLMDWLTDD